MTRVVLATGNPGKVAEMQITLQEFGFSVVPQSEFDIPEAIENGLSFVENALIKARHACQLTGLPAIADDSGIEVDALQGAPGIYSARYALETPEYGEGDEANNKRLLAELANIVERTARFVCVIVFMQHAKDPTPLICQGFWEGEIATTPAGDNGFGYDPIFFVPEQACNSAELPATTKKEISHRAKALANLKQQLQQ
ncbi:MAG: RdgB/HAM1 family non-canonical purine NTP pyrophosphatase [Pseudomonadota bacterium]